MKINPDRAIVALSLLGMVALHGCAVFDGGAYGSQLMFAKPMAYTNPISCKSGVYTVELVFTTAEEARKECLSNCVFIQNQYARAACVARSSSSMACYRGGALPKIVTAHPKSWNDAAAMQTIGHEICHLAEADHE